MSELEKNDYSNHYDDKSFWKKIRKIVKIAGYEVLEKALLLFYTLEKKELPRWARGVIISALGYFILPTDAIADLTPVVGYSDDLGVLALALATVISHIDDEIKAKAKAKLNEWFPEAQE